MRFNSFQEISLQELKETRRNNLRKALIVLPPGTGKTLIFVEDCLKYNKVLYLAPQIELLKQTRDYFLKYFNGDKTISKINELNVNKRFNFLTISKLKNRIKNIDKKLFDYVCIDEAHHSPAKTYIKIINHLNPPFLLGLTATPYRLDKKDILNIFDSNIIKVGSLFDAIKNGYLNKFDYYGFKDDIDLSGLKINGVDYNRKDLDRKLFVRERDIKIIEEYKNYCYKNNRKTIVFCNSIRHAKRCHNFFKEQGIFGELVTYKTSKKAREIIFNNLRKGKVNLVFCVNIFNEGVDFPYVDTALLLRPTVSFTLFFQQIGRVLRVNKNKKKSLILDFVGNHPHSYKTREWISNGLVFQENQKPIYEFPLGCEVNFDKEVIDIMDKQIIFRLLKNIDLIVKDYLKIRLKRPLFKEEIFLKGSKRLRAFLYYDNWQNLMFYMDEKINMKIIRQQELISLGLKLGIKNVNLKMVEIYFRDKKQYKDLVSSLEPYHEFYKENISIKRICPRCKEQPAKSLHHIVPREFEGKDNKENIIFLCYDCHNKVEMFTYDLFIKKRIFSSVVLRGFIINKSFPILEN